MNEVLLPDFEERRETLRRARLALKRAQILLENARAMAEGKPVGHSDSFEQFPDRTDDPKVLF